MSQSIDVSQQYAFRSSIDVIAMLDRLEVEYLDVNDSRAIVIFAGGILNLETQIGELTDLECAEITVYDLPLNNESNTENETEAAAELIEDFKNQLLSAIDSV